MENSYLNPHLRRIWGTSVVFVQPLLLVSASSERPDLIVLSLLTLYLCSWKVLKAIFGSKAHCFVFIACFLFSIALVLIHLLSGSYLPFVFLPFIPLFWGVISYSAILKILENAERSNGSK